MIEALARIRNDSILSRPVKKSVRGRGVLLRLVDRARALPPRLYIGAILSALLAGIGVNALILQRERHPAPLFAPAPSKIVAVAPPQTPPPAPAAAREIAAPVAPAPRPLPQVSAAQSAPDPIGDLLRGESPAADDAHLVVAAQTALARLGYPVKADGAQGAATDQALRDFERAHGLPNSTEITPHLVKQLTTAVRAAAR
jgi:hypothetical protein